MLSRFVLAAFLTLSASVFMAQAQSIADIGGPAELPPASFAGNQYVDSRGCIFMRAGVGGRVVWAPRLNSQREVLCGYPPTFGAPAAPVAVAEAPPAPADVVTPAPVDVRPAAVASVVAPPSAPRVPRAVRPGQGYTPVAPAATARRIGCFTNTPVPMRVRLTNGGTAVLCTRGDGTLEGARAPIYPPGSGVGASLSGPEFAARPPAAAHARVTAPPMATARVTQEPATIRQPATAARLYVQVGAFAVPSNATGARERLKALGLSTARANAQQGGRALTIVFAGPFTSSGAAHAALNAARSAGFDDAFIR